MYSKLPCGYCGWQEIDHEGLKAGTLVGYVEPSKIQKGYLFTVLECLSRGGYMMPRHERKGEPSK